MENFQREQTLCNISIQVQVPIPFQGIFRPNLKSYTIQKTINARQKF